MALLPPVSLVVADPAGATVAQPGLLAANVAELRLLRNIPVRTILELVSFLFAVMAVPYVATPAIFIFFFVIIIVVVAVLVIIATVLLIVVVVTVLVKTFAVVFLSLR